jgi:SAM-dependent methyltransferase
MIKIADEMNFGRCPGCNGSDVLGVLSTQNTHQTYHIIQCKRCRLCRTFPLPRYASQSARDFSGYYGEGVHKFLPVLQKARNTMMRLRAKHSLQFVPDRVKRPRVLDVGCAEGRLLKALHDCGCECWGVEHPSYPYQRFLNSDRITYIRGELDFIDLPEETFDMIFLWHVLEHMDNPRQVLRRLYKSLAPEGILILAVPNFMSLEAKKFKGAWFHLDIPWHKYHFSERSITYLMEKSHLRIIKSSAFCLEQGPFGLLQSILNALGWPKNEFYEFLKGNVSPGRVIHLVVQSLTISLLIIPGLITSFITSIGGQGSILKLILKKK